MKLDKYANKSNFTSVLWIGAFIIVAIFFKQIYSALMRLFGNEKSEKNAEIETKNKAELMSLEKIVLPFYSKKLVPKNRDYYKSIADQIEIAFNKTWTDWAGINSLIEPMKYSERMCVYFEFGTRLNTEYADEQGLLANWIIMEQNMRLPFMHLSDITKTKELFYSLRSWIPSCNILNQSN